MMWLTLAVTAMLEALQSAIPLNPMYSIIAINWRRPQNPTPKAPIEGAVDK